MAICKPGFDKTKDALYPSFLFRGSAFSWLLRKFQITLLAACGGYGQSVCYYSSRAGRVAALLAAQAVNHSMKPSVTGAAMLAGNRPSGLRTSPAPVMLPPLYYHGDVQILYVPDHQSLSSAASVLSAFFPQQEGPHARSVSLPCISLRPVYVSENRQEYVDEREREEQRKLRDG